MERDLAACSLTLLGGLGLRSAGGKELALSTRKDRLLLAYLALNSARPLARDRLAGLLWGDRGETQARDSLRQSLAAIRQAFRQVDLDPIVSSRDSVSFHPNGIEIDAITFEQLASEPSTRARAAALYRGALLEGIDGVTPDLEAWLGPERERLASIAVGLVEQIAQSSASSEAAICLARQLLARDPLCEPVYRALMRLHVAGGERAAALKLYATCRDTLKRELSATPDLPTETLYRDILTGRPARSTASQPVKPAADRPSIAVLPFSNLSGDPELDHLCEGLAEDIITGLGRFQLLFVIDRHSSSMIAKQETDIAEIGRRLGVVHLVQGSLQRQGDRVRITVRLLDAATRAQVWGEAYDHPLSDLATIPDTITRALVSTLHGRVESALMEQGRRKPKLAAYDCVLRGIKHLRGYAPSDNERAVELFQQAVELDPDYALAHAYRGFADVVLHNYDETPSDILARSLEMASMALQMDSHDGRIHWILGMICGASGDLKGEEQHYQRAMALNPNDANVIASSGALCALIGRAEEGIERIRQAMRLNPYHPEWYWIDLGIVFYMARRYDDAIEAYRQRSKPGHWVWSRLAACYAQLGRKEEAAAAVAHVLQLKPDFSIAKLRRAGWGTAESQHVKDGMRKAGLPE
jgi:TolB-like protein